jgi:transposase
MLNDATGFKKIYIACGKTDLRRGIDGLAGIIKYQFNLDPFDKNTLFLFCGGSSTKIKGLLWEGDGFLLLYKRLESGAFSWPRTAAEMKQITPSQYKQLMHGLQIVSSHPIKEIKEPMAMF